VELTGFVDPDTAEDAAVTEHDRLADLGRPVESPRDRLGWPVARLEPRHLLESTPVTRYIDPHSIEPRIPRGADVAELRAYQLRCLFMRGVFDKPSKLPSRRT
jgi:hypothetical protein